MPKMIKTIALIYFEPKNESCFLSFNDQQMYRATFPSINDVVIAQIASLTEMGAYVSLLEFGDLEGFIPAKELSKSRAAARSIKVQQTIVAQVISVDAAKKYVDLSRKCV